MWPFKKKYRPLIIDKTPEKITAIHPEYKKLITHAFDIKKDDEIISFYQFKEMGDVPSDRYGSMNNFIEDNGRKFTNEELLHYSSEAITNMESNTIEGTTNTLLILKMMKMRSELVMSVDIVMRLISCVFFTKDEDLRSYDWDIGDDKIKLFEDYGLKSFFLTEPIKTFLPVTNISAGDINLILEGKKVTEHLLKQLRELGISTTNPYDGKKQMLNYT